MQRAIFIVITTMILLQPPAVTHAGWVDDWLSQMSQTSAGYYEGQKRGYFTAGTFSARWRTGNDYLVSITKPRIKAGCGGIDLFLGGMSFMMAPHYLVQKLQNALQAAPAVAFDMALNTLCSQCSNIIKQMEKIINSLNQLQIDDCKTAKVLVASLHDYALPGGKKGKLAEAVADWAQSSGVTDLYHNVKEELTTANHNLPSGYNAYSDATKKCPKEIKAVFGTTGYLISNLSNQIGMNDSSFTEMVRGLVGDIYLEEVNNVFHVTYIPPCSENNPTHITDLLEGKVKAKQPVSSSSNCYEIRDSNRNLRKYVTDTMTGIANKINSESKLTTAEDVFINSHPFPIALALKTAVGTSQESSMIALLSEATAKAYAFKMMSELYNKAYHIMEQGKYLMTMQTNPTGSDPEHTCKIEFMSDAMMGLLDMKKRLSNLMEGLKKSYANEVTDVIAILSLTNKLKTFNSIANAVLSDSLKRDVLEIAQK